MKKEDCTPQKINCQTVNCQISEIIYSLNSKETMKYDITKQSAQKTPTLEEWTKCIQIMLSSPQKICTNP